MKKLGIIGGAGPLASALFYEILVEESYRQGKALPELLLLNYPFHRGLTPEEGENNREMLQGQLRDCLATLEGYRVSMGVLVCNTLHLELAKIRDNRIPFISIPRSVIAHAQREGKTRLLLIGTQNTCGSSLYREQGIEICCPNPHAQEVVGQVIDQILLGNVSIASTRLLEKVIEEHDEPFDGVILGCTDLTVLHRYFPLQISQPIYDSVTVAAHTLIGSL